MALPFRGSPIVALAALLAAGAAAAGDDTGESPCTEDAMLVFDASGSMAGNRDRGILTRAQVYLQ